MILDSGRIICQVCHLEEILQQYDSLLDVCRISRPHQTPGVLELRTRAHLGTQGEGMTIDKYMTIPQPGLPAAPCGISARTS